MDLKTAMRWTTLVPLFLIPFIPLLVADGNIIPNLFFPFITVKGFAFRILVEIALAGYVLLALLDARYRPKFSWTLAIYGVLVVWMALADAFAINPHKAFWSNFERMDGWVTLIHMFAFFVVLSGVLTVERKWRAWWMWFLSAAAIVCAYGLFQLAGMADIHQGGVRVDASLGNAAYLAVYLLFVTAVSLWQGIESKGLLRYVLFALSLVSTGIIFATATRGAIIGLAGAIALGATLWMVEAGKKHTRLIAGGVLGLLVLLGGAFFALKESPFIQQDPTLARIASISVADGSTRFALWGMALEGVAQRPIFGWGQEGFNYIFQKHYKPSLYGQEPWFDRAHNTYFDWLTAGGVPALLLFLALLGSAVFAFYRKTATRPERILLISALAAYMFQALFVFDNLMSYVCLAALLATAHAVSSRPWEKLEKMSEIKEDAGLTVGLPLFGAVLVAVVWMVNVPSIVSAHNLVYGLGYMQSAPQEGYARVQQAIADGGLGQQEVAEQFLTMAVTLVGRGDVDPAVRAQVLKAALENMKAQTDRIPHDARLRIQYALGLRAAKNYPEAIAQSTQALTESPNKQTMLMEQGYEYWESGNVTAARDTFVKMYELDPSYKDLAPFAASGYLITGDAAKADELLMKVYGTTHVDSDVLVFAYFQAKRYNDLIAVLQIHLESDPSLQSYLRLASALVVAGRTLDARTVAEQAKEKFPDQIQTISAFIAQLPK